MLLAMGEVVVLVVLVLVLVLVVVSAFAGGDCGGVFRLHPRGSCGVPLHGPRQGDARPAPQSAGAGVLVATLLLACYAVAKTPDLM